MAKRVGMRHFRLRRARILALSLALTLGGAAHGDPGASWDLVLPSSGASPSATDLFGDGTGYALMNHRLLATGDGGETWLPLQTPEATVDLMSFATPQMGYISSGFGVFRTDDGGESWIEVTFPVPTGDEFGAHLEWLETIRGTDVVLLSFRSYRNGCENVGVPLSVIRSEDAGKTWTKKQFKGSAFGYEIEHLDERRGLLLMHRMRWAERSGCSGVLRTHKSIVFRTTDGGRTYRAIHKASFEDEDPVISVAMPSRRVIILGTQHGRVLRSGDGGRDFLHVKTLRPASGAEPGRVDTIEFTSRKIGYAGLDGTGLWRTDDGGKTWRREASPYEARYPSSEWTPAWSSIGPWGPEDAIAVGPEGLARRVP